MDYERTILSALTESSTQSKTTLTAKMLNWPSPTPIVTRGTPLTHTTSMLATTSKNLGQTVETGTTRQLTLRIRLEMHRIQMGKY